MEKDKSRGIKHIKDKRKYKGNSTKNEKYVPAKTRPNLESNWDRYEQEDEDPRKLTSSTDFSILANAPISRGNYFQFKSDRNTSDDQEIKNSDLFCLNMDLLSTCVLTVPFHKRLGISEDYFTSKQLSVMEKLSLENKRIYEEKVNNLKKAVNDSKNTEVSTEKDSDKIIDRVVEDKKLAESLDQPSDKLINETCSGIENLRLVKKDEDLEQWLDDILDD